MSNFKRNLFATIIITISVVLSITSAWNDAVIVDEVPHIGAGYSYLVKQDMRLNPEHPPLAKSLAAIPLLFLDLKQTVFETEFWQTDINGQWNFGRNLMFNSGNDADLIKHAAKLPMIVFLILAAVLVFKWARRLYGNTGGLIALILFSFSPTVLAHSRFVTTDIPALFGVLAASYFFVKYLKSPGQKNIWLAGLAFGVALLVKFSTFLLVPFFLLLAIIYGLMSEGSKILNTIRKLGHTILIFIIGFVVVVWPVYYFHTANYPPERQYRDTENLLSSYGNRNFADPVVWASDKPVLRAAAQYGLGLLMVNQRVAGGNTTYFLGEVSRFGWKKYFPIVYFLKEPLAWWGLVLIALLYLGWQAKKPSRESFKRGIDFIKNHLDEFAMILWLLIYWVVSIEGSLNIGVRHLLPTYPFAILLVSGQIAKILKIQNSNDKLQIKFKAQMTKFLKFGFWNSFGIWVLVFGLLAWYVIDVVRVHPYYLTYFNQVAGGPSGGYRYVADSNLDWGQDLKRFGDWVKENNIPKIEFDYFGWADPYYYLRDSYIGLNSKEYTGAEDFKSRNRSDGWLAVSATFLQGSQGPEDMPNPVNYLWLNSYKPATVIGNSIFIYRIR